MHMKIEAIFMVQVLKIVLWDKTYVVQKPGSIKPASKQGTQ